MQNKRWQAADQENLFSLMCIAAELNSQNQDIGHKWDTEIKWMTSFTTRIRSIHLTWKTTKNIAHLLLTYKVIICLNVKQYTTTTNDCDYFTLTYLESKAEDANFGIV
jgi:hypothetical protein